MSRGSTRRFRKIYLAGGGGLGASLGYLAPAPVRSRRTGRTGGISLLTSLHFTHRRSENERMFWLGIAVTSPIPTDPSSFLVCLGVKCRKAQVSSVVRNKLSSVFITLATSTHL
jgi:hypothetical protein